MLREKLLIGQYLAIDSPVARLSAQCKLLCTLLYMIALFVANNWYQWGLLSALCLAAILLSRAPWRALWRALRPVLVFCAMIVVVDTLFYPGEPLWQWGIVTVTREGIHFGLAMGLRLLLIVLFAALLTLTTEPIRLTDGLEALFAPLKKIGFPAHEIAMMMALALRFIPTMLDEFERIMLAQRARGARIAKRNLWRKAQSLLPVLVPLFAGAFRRADDLAQAMEARCYRGGRGRSKWKTQRFGCADLLTLLFFLLLLAALILLRMELL